ncbi:MAG: cytochrome c oxidase accessory protein CcoG [Rhodospirillales bacterium]|nr:cytochrome c oxidase accessory protein CcoG [Rhodospirillales bacterium]
MADVHADQDALSRKEQSLYADRVKVYPRKIEGNVRRIKWAVLIVLLGIYYIAPWLRWDRGPAAPDQAFLIDMPHRRAYFLWIEIWPQELYFLVGLLILGALGMFFVTSLFGRIWCGYTCPQTVWTDLFMWVERLIEGDRNQRIRLDKAPMSVGKSGRKIAKHSAWMVIAALTGGAWIMYFNDAMTVVPAIVTGQAGPAVYFFLGLFTFLTYLLAGWAREQVCIYMCPWPRFQSAMYDEDTLIVTYRERRGEPRGKHRKGETWEGRGHCVDCRHCVAVCPMGIDIRDGVQLECIGCGLCIDACDKIMGKLDLPKGLIGYDSPGREAAIAAGQKPKHRFVRPRTIVYTIVFILISAAMVWGLFSRTTVDVNVLHDRNPVFVTLSDGSVRNGYTIKVLNKTREDRVYRLAFDGLDYAVMTVVGQEDSASRNVARLTSIADSVTTYRVFLTTPPELADFGQIDFDFVLTERETGEEARHSTVLRGPGS